MIELIFLGADSCLTDGKVIYTSNGSVIKEFDVKDGATMETWIKLGKKVAIITRRNCPCVSAHAKDLKIEIVHRGVKDKLTCVKKILEKLNLDLSQYAAIGGHFNDKNLLENVSLGFKPKDTHRDLKVDITLDKKGGKTAVTQMIEYIAEKNNMQEEWDKLWL